MENKWFDDKELPIITNKEELELAMGAVKARFNGHPHRFTRNDYLLFINTLYAALLNISNTAVLTNDLTTNYTPEVGYVGPDTAYKKGDSLEKIITDILVGLRDKEELPKPSINGGNFLNSATIEISSDEEYADKSLIYYTTSDHPGWRIYDGKFTITKDTTIKAKLVPKYDYYRFYEESEISTETYYKSIQLTYPEINGESPFISSRTVTITHTNDVVNCEIYYTTDNDENTKQYTGPFVIDEPTRITAYVTSSESKYIPSDKVNRLFQEKLQPYPNVEDYYFYPGESVIINITPNLEYADIATLHYIINGVDQECGEVLNINQGCTVQLYYKANDPELYVDSAKISFNIKENKPIPLQSPGVQILNYPIYSQFIISKWEVYEKVNAKIYYEINGNKLELTIKDLPYIGKIFENNTVVKVWAELNSDPAYSLISEIKEITSLFTELPPLNVVFEGDGIVHQYRIEYSSNNTHKYYNYPILSNLYVDDENYQQVKFYINGIEWGGGVLELENYELSYIKFNYEVINEGGVRFSSDVTNITLSRQYLPLNGPIIDGDKFFDNEAFVQITTDLPEEYAEHVQLYVDDNLIDLGEWTNIISDTTTIDACVKVLDEWQGYYQAELKCVSKTFTKNEPIVIYSTMVDPVGLTYTYELPNDDPFADGPDIIKVTINSIGDQFDVSTVPQNYGDGTYKKNNSYYFVKTQNNESPIILTSRDLSNKNVSLFEKSSKSQNWLGSDLNTANTWSSYEYKGMEEIDGKNYYKYQYNLISTGAVLYQLTIN